MEDVKSVLITLRKEKLYANFNNDSFCIEKVNFLDFIVCKNGVEVDEEKVNFMLILINGADGFILFQCKNGDQRLLA